MADSSEYLARIRKLADNQDFIAVQHETPQALSALIDGAPIEKLRQRRQPDKWSVVEILAHLADDEIAASWRYRQMLEHNGATLSRFDQDLWARVGNYRSWTANDALSLFRLLREANLRLLDNLREEQWRHYGIHAERGKITIKDLARHMAGHDLNHLEQVRNLLRS